MTKKYVGNRRLFDADAAAELMFSKHRLPGLKPSTVALMVPLEENIALETGKRLAEETRGFDVEMELAALVSRLGFMLVDAVRERPASVVSALRIVEGATRSLAQFDWKEALYTKRDGDTYSSHSVGIRLFAVLSAFDALGERFSEKGREGLEFVLSNTTRDREGWRDVFSILVKKHSFSLVDVGRVLKTLSDRLGKKAFEFSSMDGAEEFGKRVIECAEAAMRENDVPMTKILNAFLRGPGKELAAIDGFLSELTGVVAACEASDPNRADTGCPEPYF